MLDFLFRRKDVEKSVTGFQHVNVILQATEYDLDLKRSIWFVEFTVINV